jgi:hypothetical protein
MKDKTPKRYFCYIYTNSNIAKIPIEMYKTLVKKAYSLAFKKKQRSNFFRKEWKELLATLF